MWDSTSEHDATLMLNLFEQADMRFPDMESNIKHVRLCERDLRIPASPAAVTASNM